MARGQARPHLYKERLRLAPPKAPGEFPPELPIDELTEVEREQLNKWVKTLEGIQPAQLAWGPVRHRFGCMSPKRFLHLDYTVDGLKKTCSLGRNEGTGQYPTLFEAFETFAAEVDALRVALTLTGG